VCRSKHVEPSINFGIINSITKLHVVCICTESSTMHGSMNVKNAYFMFSKSSVLCSKQTSCAFGGCLTDLFVVNTSQFREPSRPFKLKIYCDNGVDLHPFQFIANMAPRIALFKSNPLHCDDKRTQ
jgi:hypothetical protein